MQIGADLRDDVVVLVGTEDRAAAPRLGALPVDSVGEALPGAQIETVLKLERHGPGLVDHRVARAQAEGALSGIGAAPVRTGIGEVEEGLSEEPALGEP